MVEFRDTDPRPLPERRPVSNHYGRAVERTGDEEPRLAGPSDELRYVEARARHAAFYEIPDRPTSPQDERERDMKRRAFVAGYVRAFYLERR